MSWRTWATRGESEKSAHFGCRFLKLALQFTGNLVSGKHFDLVAIKAIVKRKLAGSWRSSWAS